MYHSHVSMIYDTDTTPEMYHGYWYWYCTKNVSWYLILDTFLVSRYVSWYMYHWYSPTLQICRYAYYYLCTFFLFPRLSLLSLCGFPLWIKMNSGVPRSHYLSYRLSRSAAYRKDLCPPRIITNDAIGLTLFTTGNSTFEQVLRFHTKPEMLQTVEFASMQNDSIQQK